MIIYYVKEGQSLVDLCHEVQVENPEYLRDYHHQNCSLSERFEDEIVPGMKLYIPSSKETREINKKIREENKSLYDFPARGRFPFDFKLLEGTYQITQTAYSDDIIIAKYENKVRLDFEGIKNSHYHFLFSVFDFRKNEDVPDSKAGILAKMSIEVFYPIQYIIDVDGKIVDIVLTKKTEDLLSELDSIKNFIPDPYSSDYIEKMKDIAGNPELIFQKFKNSLLSSFMFGIFYRTQLGSWTSSDVYYDFYPWIFDALPIRFKFQNTLLPKDSVDDESVKIQQNGISSDHRSQEDLYMADTGFNDQAEITEKAIDCEHFAEYIFNRENWSLNKIEAKFQCFGNEGMGREDFLLERITDHYYI
ncbi:uncharacterized protein CHSO_1474 [Chryseobacterium sp. StRB126]|uniref:hypothetical protein n=1 Tax=Chryseobacterium sp. StRB126 TaxID=878220 RepID=UPI0004E983D5|nr:hypothetical protein [Chryseobacterium sp. StRB126]BAP30511.1 uncharacterized protein CHSO_1474 [Chryseobacterium sp. StRB126]